MERLLSWRRPRWEPVLRGGEEGRAGRFCPCGRVVWGGSGDKADLSAGGRGSGMSLSVGVLTQRAPLMVLPTHWRLLVVVG